MKTLVCLLAFGLILSLGCAEAPLNDSTVVSVPVVTHTYTDDCSVDIYQKFGVYPDDDSNSSGMVTYIYAIGYFERGYYHGPPVRIGYQYWTPDGKFLVQKQYEKILKDGDHLYFDIDTDDAVLISHLEKTGLEYYFIEPK